MRSRIAALAVMAAMLAVPAALGAAGPQALAAAGPQALAASARPRAQALAASARPRALLVGVFQLRGRITTAVRVRGEHRGEHVTRLWLFTPLCARGPCKRVRLLRQRSGGSDRLVLHWRRSGMYVGHGRFYAPLRCGSHVARRGESVPFTITVRVTKTVPAFGTRLATRVHASYVNARRTNRTRCVAIRGHDAAAYRGRLVAG
jgi:hypothetical protein